MHKDKLGSCGPNPLVVSCDGCKNIVSERYMWLGRRTLHKIHAPHAHQRQCIACLPSCLAKVIEAYRERLLAAKRAYVAGRKEAALQRQQLQAAPAAFKVWRNELWSDVFYGTGETCTIVAPAGLGGQAVHGMTARS
jgi:hypothetical protein